MLLAWPRGAHRVLTAMQLAPMQQVTEHAPTTWVEFFVGLFTSTGGLLILGLAVGFVVQTIRVWRLQRTLRSRNGADR